MTQRRLLTLAAAFLASAAALPAKLQPNGGQASLAEGLKSSVFSDASITPCPACLCAAPTGEVFVGVDLLGSLGKGSGKGRIVRLIDKDNDGKAETHTVFAEVDNPRGLISVGTKLWVLHTVIPEGEKLTGMHVSLFEDKDWDGVADGPPKRLISDISPPKHNQDRGADHTTNGIRMGIDGWIYIAVGDFGISGAKGTDGTELTMLGGGVVRFRPDGSELEVYTTGLRNIYDIAIDPLMNIYTRGNTNDGGGWNVRFIHHIQTAEYGYPMLFKNFTNEILPALVDVGGGSGTGAMFLSEPGWPKAYTDVPIMCDWGRSQLVIHRLTPDGASFTQEPEEFIKLHQITDVDTDASGRLYAGAWAGAGYKGNPDKGWVEVITPASGWSYKPFANPAGLGTEALVNLLRSDSATVRMAASQELLNRPSPVANGVAHVLLDKKASLESRVAALFTYKQMVGAKANPALAKVAREDAALREWALRALADRKTQLADVPKDLLVEGLQDSNPRVQVAAAVALGRLGDASVANDLLAVSSPPGAEEEEEAAAAPPKWASKASKGHKLHKVDLDVNGWKQLYLIVGDGGDGTGEDHAAWFEPRFVNAVGVEVKLSSLKWKEANSGWGKIGYGISATGKPLRNGKGEADPDGLGTHSVSTIVFDVPPGAIRFKANAGLADTSRGKGRVQFMVSDSMPALAAGSKGNEGPHATPNSPIILPHVAVKALVDLKAIDACVDAVGGPNTTGALWALSKIHDVRSVDGLIAKYGSAAAETAQRGILRTLIRLHHEEAPYDGSWWWSTRPDTRGPYYKPIKWAGSEKISAFVKARYDAGEHQNLIASHNAKTRSGIAGVEAVAKADTKPMKEEPKVDLDAIARAKGQVGKMSIEDVMLALDDVKGDAKRGAQLFTTQGCTACHTTSSDQPAKGPFMGQVGAILSREQIAESILKPNASISQGFATISLSTKDGKTMVGFITGETADELEMRDIVGQVHRFKTANVKTRHELEISMMPPGLANALSVEDFAALIAYLESMKG